jgi:hypothetical protein
MLTQVPINVQRKMLYICFEYAEGISKEQKQIHTFIILQKKERKDQNY